MFENVLIFFGMVYGFCYGLWFLQFLRHIRSNTILLFSRVCLMNLFFFINTFLISLISYEMRISLFSNSFFIFCIRFDFIRIFDSFLAIIFRSGYIILFWDNSLTFQVNGVTHFIKKNLHYGINSWMQSPSIW